MWQTLATIAILVAVGVVAVRWCVKRFRRPEGCTGCEGCPYCAERKRKGEHKMRV